MFSWCFHCKYKVKYVALYLTKPVHIYTDLSFVCTIQLSIIFWTNYKLSSLTICNMKKRQISLFLSLSLQCWKMASLRSPSSPSDGYKRFSDDFANTSINNYGSNVTSKWKAMIICTVAARFLYAFVVITIHFVFHLTFCFNFSPVLYILMKFSSNILLPSE